jgi:hypothetical protein
MIMRYRGGGVGHTSTRSAVNSFLEDRHTTEMTRTVIEDEPPDEEVYTDDTIIVEELPAGDFEGLREAELDEDPEEEGNEEENDYGYRVADDSDDEQVEEEGELPKADEGLLGDEVEGEIEQLGYARY